MRFIISSSSLLKQLSSISGVIASNPIVPILENFLFEVKESTLTITASDMQTSMITEMEVESKKSGSICVPAKILIDTLKNLPEQPLTFTIDEETYSIEISSDRGKYKLSGENATDFPKAPVISGGDALEIPSDILLRAINMTLFAASNDELRPAMTGVYISMNDTNVTFVATDGHRLVRYRRVDIASDSNTSILIPKKALTLLKSSLTSDNTLVVLEFNTSNAYFSFGNTKMICRLLDERFPDYENAIPVNNPNKLNIDRNEFLNSLKITSIYANKTTHQVRLKMAGSELQISAEDIDFSNEANERLSCDFVGEDMEIGFNAKFLLEVLNTMDARDVTVNLSAPNRAGVVTPTEQNANEDLLMLVMPVMLNSYS
ncbi:MAG TPA: DNA polymerase III subunit beta [Cytophagales bacterium]|jgi:DNA polymerase-3 subunit beta|nr:DNA polymerase III subunit beta [Cytophagales bacterium]